MGAHATHMQMRDEGSTSGGQEKENWGSCFISALLTPDPWKLVREHERRQALCLYHIYFLFLFCVRMMSPGGISPADSWCSLGSLLFAGLITLRDTCCRHFVLNGLSAIHLVHFGRVTATQHMMKVVVNRLTMLCFVNKSA